MLLIWSTSFPIWSIFFSVCSGEAVVPWRPRGLGSVGGKRLPLTQAQLSVRVQGCIFVPRKTTRHKTKRNKDKGIKTCKMGVGGASTLSLPP